MRYLPTCLLYAGLLIAGAASASTDDNFLAAREAYAGNRPDQFEKLARKIPDDYPLHLYLDYWRLKTQSASTGELERFARAHPDSAVSGTAWQDLAQYYGRTEDWVHFREVEDKAPRRDTQFTCYDLRARLARHDPTAVGAGLKLWLTAEDLPSNCDPLFTSLAEANFLTDGIRYARLRLALDASNMTLSKTLIGALEQDAKDDIQRLDLARTNPEKVLALDAATQIQSEISFFALRQVAVKDPDRAAALWQTRQAGFSENDQYYGWGVIAVAGARQVNPKAVGWFLAARDQLSDSQNIWKARTMLRAGRWQDLLRSIADMPFELRDDAVWRYWKARAYQALNMKTRAYPIFASLSHEIHYYGLLAEEELPARLESRSADYIPSPREIDQTRSLPGIRRALLLHKLELNTNAGQEWDWALHGADDQRLLAAAEIARQAQWYDRAIRTAEETRTIHSMDLRYLTPYRDLAESYAHKNGLDPALVYGLIRQESRFTDYARSSVGARGLMQIMPATARWIARHLGLGKHADARIGDPDVNLKFGTYYLKQLLTGFDGSAVLATAGYNAGPGRSRRWQADKPLEGAIYVESIPIAETREYVKKVLANAMYYRQRLGLPDVALKERLGMIPALATAPASPDPDSR